MLREQGDHEPADPPVTVGIRMDRFELHVQKARSRQCRQAILVMDVFFERAEELRQLIRRRRNISAIGWPASTNPILAAAR